VTLLAKVLPGVRKEVTGGNDRLLVLLITLYPLQNKGPHDTFWVLVPSYCILISFYMSSKGSSIELQDKM
jgi:hypothetical protein